MGHATLSQQLHLGKETTFANSASGLAALLSWVDKPGVIAVMRKLLVLCYAL